jgi:two-component system chemotaxis response regulator CheY
MKFLIIDDSNFAQIVTANLLKKFFPNAANITAKNGLEGFKKYKETNPDYVFVDLLMPGLNGIELIRMIKEYDSKANIFVITADVQRSIKEETEALGIKAFINKPFNEEKAKSVYDIIKEDANE